MIPQFQLNNLFTIEWCLKWFVFCAALVMVHVVIVEFVSALHDFEMTA